MIFFGLYYAKLYFCFSVNFAFFFLPVLVFSAKLLSHQLTVLVNSSIPSYPSFGLGRVFHSVWLTWCCVLDFGV